MPGANDLSLEEWEAVVALIRRTIDDDKFPFSDRIRTLRSALHKLDPKSAPQPKAPLPPPTGADGRPPKDAALAPSSGK